MLTSKLASNFNDETTIIVKPFDSTLISSVKENRTFHASGIPKVILYQISLFVSAVFIICVVEVVQFLFKVFFLVWFVIALAQGKQGSQQKDAQRHFSLV